MRLTTEYILYARFDEMDRSHGDHQSTGTNVIGEQLKLKLQRGIPDTLQILSMSDFLQAPWNNLLALIHADDGGGIAARAFDLFASGALEWSAPDDEMQKTPVMLAYWGGYLAAASALVAAGADYQAKDSHGRRVTWYAQNFGKGATEGDMSTRISATTRRLSMESVIRERVPAAPDSDSPKPRRRSSGV